MEKIAIFKTEKGLYNITINKYTFTGLTRSQKNEFLKIHEYLTEQNKKRAKK